METTQEIAGTAAPDILLQVLNLIDNHDKGLPLTIEQLGAIQLFRQSKVGQTVLALADEVMA